MRATSSPSQGSPRSLRRVFAGAGSFIAAAALAAVLATTVPASAATIEWKGHSWQVTSGAMAGACQGAAANVSVDGSGYLHLRIAQAGGVWSAAELFSSDAMGPGTLQWQVEGPVDTLDPQVVLGFFPYGPAAGVGVDGTNEIDIEFSRWNQPTGPNGDFTIYPASGAMKGEQAYSFSLGGSSLSTSRIVWSASSITESVFSGAASITESAGLLQTWTYAPSNPTTNLPERPLPVGMNLWCFEAPPSNGAPVEIVVRDFAYVPEGPAVDAGRADSGASGDAAAGPDANADAGGGAAGVLDGGRGVDGAAADAAKGIQVTADGSVAGAASDAAAAAAADATGVLPPSTGPDLTQRSGARGSGCNMSPMTAMPGGVAFLSLFVGGAAAAARAGRRRAKVRRRSPAWTSSR